MNAAATIYDGSNKYIRITDIDEDSSKYISTNPVSPDGELMEKFLVKENDILFARTGASTGKSYIYDKKDGILYFAGFLIRAKIKEEYNSKFIFYQTQTSTYTRWVEIISMRSGQPGINSQEYSSLNLTLPPRKEQNKIATFLTLIDQRIETQRKIIEGYESLIKGLSHGLFKNNKAFNKKKLGSLCIIKKGHQINAIDLFDIGKYYVMNGGVNPSGYYDNYNTEADTISISEGGNSCGYVQYNDSKFWSGGHCYTLEDIDKQIVNQYLYFYLKSEQEKIMALRVGSGLPNIQKKDLERLEVNYPNIEKQNQITNFLSRIDAKLELEKSLLLKYNEQKQYLLDSLFI